MRILFLLSRFLDGGIDMVLIDYLRHLSQDPSYSLTFAIATDMGTLEVFADRIPQNVAVVHMVKAHYLTRWRKRKIKQKLPLPIKLYDESLLSPLRRFIVKRELKKLAANHDVIIDFDCCFYSFLRHIHVPKFAWFHFSFEQSLQQNRQRTLRIGRRLQYYDRIVCISETMRQECENLFPELKEKLNVIYNAKDRDAILARASEALEDTRIRQPYLLAVERLEESQKDLTTLLHAYSLLRKQWHHTEPLYLLGKGHSMANLQQLAVELGIAEHVVFLGFSSNPFPWIAHCQLLVHSAKFEGLPTILIEGLMLDKLIVATDCPTGPREILNQGKAGLLTPVGDVQAMAEAMHTALTDKALQAQLLANLQEHRQQFMFCHTEKLFKQLMNDIK
jgi:glycosyltransferase involved in cell wall biosynthesis